MKHTLFRSRAYGFGATRALGSLHFHIDVSGDLTADDELILIARRLDARGIATKVTRIVGAIKGKHFDDPEFADDYLLHTPELKTGLSTFTSYLTSLLPPVNSSADFAEVSNDVRTVLADVLNASTLFGAVVEIERVCVRIVDGYAQIVAQPFASFSDHQAELNFESHLFIDIPNSGLSLDQWVAMVEPANVPVGGWFQFQKDNVQAFRSVTFDREPNVAAVKRGYAAICAQLDQLGFEGKYSAQAVIEQVVAIWKIGKPDE